MGSGEGLMWARNLLQRFMKIFTSFLLDADQYFLRIIMERGTLWSHGMKSFCSITPKKGENYLQNKILREIIYWYKYQEYRPFDLTTKSPMIVFNSFMIFFFLDKLWLFALLSFFVSISFVPVIRGQNLITTETIVIN